MCTESEIWTEFVSGTTGGFEALYRHYVDELYNFGLRYTRDTYAIEDCIHDLFIDLDKYRTKLTSVDAPLFYLLKSFRRKLAKNLSKPATISIDTFFSRPDDLEFDTLELTREQELIFEETKKETSRQLADYLNRLPARQREIIFLKYRYDLSYEEIATLLNITVPTCRTLVYRALGKLRSGFSAADSATVVLLPVYFSLF